MTKKATYENPCCQEGCDRVLSIGKQEWNPTSMSFKATGIGFQHFQAFFSSYTFDGSVLEIFII